MCSRLVVDLRQSWEPNQRIVVVVIYIRGWQNMQDVSISLRRRDVRAAACKMCTATLQREQEHRHRFDGKHDVPEGSSPKRTSRCTRRARHHKLAINTAAMRRVASRSLFDSDGAHDHDTRGYPGTTLRDTAGYDTRGGYSCDTRVWIPPPRFF